ncbi:MAG: hypothetical protein ABIJ04_00720 [Bacteroidota bacterium]
MTQQPTDQEKYSREVEEILHKRPALLVRKGILLLTILVILLLVGSHFIKYPEKLTASVTFDTVAVHDSILLQGRIILTSAAASIVKPGQPVVMLLRTTPESTPVDVTGTIEALLPMGRGDYYTVLVQPDTQTELLGHEGTASILIGETNLLTQILNPVFAVFRSADQ